MNCSYDSALSERIYKSQFSTLKRQENDLLERQTNLDPYSQSELSGIDKSIKELTSCLSNDTYVHLNEHFGQSLWSLILTDRDYFLRKLLRLLRVRIVAYNDKVIIRGLHSSSALPILAEDILPALAELSNTKAEELSQVFSSPTKTERKAVN